MRSLQDPALRPVSAGAGPIAVAAHDQGFVAAPADTVYGVLADVDRYPLWWPGAAMARGEEPLLSLPGGPAVETSTEGHRPGVGLLIRLGHPLDGTLEWFLEAFEEGSILNAILNVRLPGGPRRARRRLRRLRAGMRSGMVALEERFR